MHKNSHRGFTLVEMAIVLTVIGIIIGGVLMGRSLLLNSRLQTVITDVNSYTTAAVNFKQTYQALPGDLNNAQSVWGADSNCSGGYGAGGGGSGTCNGSGNGKLQNLTGYSAETFLFWQHLFLAGMFSQATQDCAASTTASTTCAATANSYNSTIGFNVPAGSIRGSGFSAVWEGVAPSGDANFFPTATTSSVTTPSYGNILMFGTSNAIISGTEDYSITRDPILPADQAAQIDQKMDDGLPGSGKVLSYINGSTYAPSCATTATASTAVYNVAGSGPLCSLIFVMGL